MAAIRPAPASPDIRKPAGMGPVGDGNGRVASTAGTGWVSAAGGTPGGPGAVRAPSTSTYGRIRSGSKSSAAAASAERVSRRVSAARSAQSQDGLWSGCLGAPHCGQG
ncbi:hypothetical protein [Streptomyces sp. NPDC001851]|uniref:hypothetical protein n=1 Tax=Streptomyces sp. NPDC001851 TaxID=3154529 RepID=UPI003324B781